MKHALLYVLAPAALVLPAFAPAAARIRFHPSEGAELAKTFGTRLSLAVDDMLVELNGQEIDPEMMGGDVDLSTATFEGALALAVQDTYVALGDGRPLELLREFKSLHAEAEAFGNSESKDDDSELIGRTVRFKWNEEEGRYDVSFVGEEGDAKDLEPLGEDMDLRGLLPQSEVAEGEEWTIAWKDHLALVMPGFDFTKVDVSALGEGEDEIPTAVVEALVAELRRMFAGASATCTFRGTREVDGRELGVVGIASSIDGTLDLVPVLQAAEDIPDTAGIEQLDFALSLDLTGELLWDLAAGHFRGLDLTAELAGELTVSASIEQPEMQFELDATVEISGELGRTATAQ